METIQDLPRSKSDLLAENAILRQQLIVLKRSVKRPKFTTGDRTRLILLALARFTNFWQSSLHIVQPDTSLRWHRDTFRRYWKRKSTPKSREPRIPGETIALIKQMARENPAWGTKKIYGVFVVMEHKSRKIVHTAVTTNPTDEWTAQQVREATPWGQQPKYLISVTNALFNLITGFNTNSRCVSDSGCLIHFLSGKSRPINGRFLIFYQPVSIKLR